MSDPVAPLEPSSDVGSPSVQPVRMQQSNPSPLLPPPPPPTPTGHTGSCDAHSLFEDAPSANLFTQKRERTDSLNALLLSSSALKSCRQSFKSLSLRPPPSGSSPLTNLLANVPELVYKILAYITHITSSHGLLTSAKSFFKLEQETLDLSFTSYGDSIYSTLCCKDVYKNIKTLDLRNTKISTLPPLPISITMLGLSATSITSLERLSNLPRLQMLFALHLPISSILPLSNCTELRVLNISGTFVDSLEGLERCSRLEELEILNCPVEDLTPLESCKNIQRLNLSFTSILNFTSLLELRHLRYLSTNFVTNISDYNPHLRTLMDVVKRGSLVEIQCGQIMGDAKNQLEEAGCCVHL
ncbi:hypothetical protein TrST_g9030 [Triparma strigata]|uniref:Uncharacterized protein n=1 Tax=Triparma strigata TaxID=1606541 RepID=A0A9W6ZLA5_9STRA|nr:hypothetical protein TrST_g9030 [Triparma strigata]